MTTILALVILIVLLALKVPIAFSLLLSGLIGMVTLSGPKIAFYTLSIIPYSMTSSFQLVTVPLFILMGHLAFVSGIGEKAYTAAYKWIGNFKGGLAMA